MIATALQMLHITSCADPQMWYSDRVGQLVPLLRRLPEGDWGSQEPAGYRNIVKRLDAEEVTLMVPTDKLGHWPYIQPAAKVVHIVRKHAAERERAGRETLLCRDACMLGSCMGLGDCQEARVKPPPPPPGPPARIWPDCVNPAKPSLGQSRRASAIEATTNIVVGFVVSVWITALLLPAFGHHVTLGQNVAMTSVFTVASFVRAYGLRRFFVWIDK